MPDWKCNKCESTERYIDGKCKACKKQYSKRRYYANPKHSNLLARNWKSLNRERARASSRKGDRKDWLPGEHERAEALRPNVTQCECCGSADPRHKRGWNADHSHKTKKFRAYLCHPCNIAVAHVEKFGLDRGHQIASYLESFAE